MADQPRNRGNGPQITWVNIIATLALLATVAGGAWILFQSQFNNLEQQLRSADTATGLQIRDLRGDLDRLRDNSVLRAEHVEFVKRLDDNLAAVQKHLDAIEATRSTTGELRGRFEVLQNEINELKDRLRFLEQALRPTPPPR